MANKKDASLFCFTFTCYLYVHPEIEKTDVSNNSILSSKTTVLQKCVLFMNCQ